MSTNEIAEQKSSASAVRELDFSERTRKRAEWEAFEFSIECENKVRVVNASYGAEKDEHVYSVVVEQREDGRVIPLHCSCPAFQHQSSACKHMVSVAMHDVVLGAAVCYKEDAGRGDVLLLADGGRVAEADDGAAGNECGEDWCPGPRDCEDDPLPCFECFRGGDG